MFENAQWICLEYGHNAPWFKKPFENEDCPAFVNLPEYKNREYGSVVFTRCFTLPFVVEKAKLFICGLGFYEVRINGEMPDENRVLTPQVSDYFRYTRYDGYEVSHLLKSGRNVIEVEVCGGWFTGKDKFWGWQQMFYGNPRLIAQLDCTAENGETVQIATDTQNWEVRHGCITRSCIYDGETADFNLLPQNGYSEKRKPVEAQAPTDELILNDVPPVRIIKKIKPVKVNRISPVQIIYDFGVNGSGVENLEVCGAKGDTVTVNFSEFLNADGTLNEISCQGGGAINTDIFTLSGNGTENCRPRFTWHGFRYCRVTLSSSEIQIKNVEKLEIHSDIEETGYFNCSDEEINRLHRAYVRTQISCLMGQPLDCNQRGERKGWTGDAGVSAQEAIYNFDMEQLYKSYLDSLRRERHPVNKTVGIICPNHKSYFDGTSIDWGIAYPVILTESYKRYGDIAELKSHWQALYEYTEFYNALRQNDLLPVTMKNRNGEDTALCWFGDWYTEDKPDGQQRVAFAAGDKNHRQNPEFAGNLFYLWLLRLAAQTAKTIGLNDIAEKYLQMRERTRKALCDKYYDTNRHILGSGGQFLLAFALWEKVVPEEENAFVLENLIKSFSQVGYHSYMGIFGQRFIGDVLREYGREDVLYKILTVKGYPGLMNMIAKGQTTVAENLTGGDNDVWGSGCHCMFAAFDTNFHRILGGITVDRFCDIFVTIAPCCPAGLTFAEDRQKIKEGEIYSKWERCDNGKIKFTVNIPDGVKAELRLHGTAEKTEQTVGGGNYVFEL